MSRITHHSNNYIDIMTIMFVSVMFRITHHSNSHVLLVL